MKPRPTKPSFAFIQSVCHALELAAEAHRPPLTLYKVCLSARLSTSKYQQIMDGRANLTLDTLHRLASALNTTPAKILRLAEIERDSK